MTRRPTGSPRGTRGTATGPVAAGRPARPGIATHQAGYSGTPLAKKLGVKEGARVALLGAPPGIVGLLRPIPNGVVFVRVLRARPDLILWFVRSGADLTRRMTDVRRALGRDGLWIIWPKLSSGVKTDLKEDVVRSAGLAAALVDYKVCAVDQTWSGLKFAPRRDDGRERYHPPA